MMDPNVQQVSPPLYRMVFTYSGRTKVASNYHHTIPPTFMKKYTYIYIYCE